MMYYVGMYDRFSFDKDKMDYTCRGCGNKVLGKPLTQPIEAGTDYTFWLIADCPSTSCNTRTFVVYDALNGYVQQTYPPRNTNANDFLKDIPEPIRKDLAEGRKCSHAGAYRAAVVMYRRVIQQIALNKIGLEEIKKHKATNDLKKQIELLVQANFFIKQQAEMAYEVKEFGNFGAHPQDDGLDDIGYEELDLIEDIVDNLVVQVYVTPSNTARLKAKRDATLTEKGE